MSERASVGCPLPAVELDEFVQQLSRMVLCCGEWPTPSTSCVRLLEPLLRVEMSVLMSRAELACSARRSHRLTVEDVLLACGRDRYVLSRAVSYFRQAADRQAAADEPASASTGSSVGQLQRVLAHVRKMRAECVAPGEDQVLTAQARRLDLLTSRMTADQYSQFCLTRFSRPQRAAICQLFVKRLVSPDTRVCSTVMDLLLFLMRDLVGRLVDACYLAVEDREGGLEACSSPLQARIKPAHVLEAVRRLQTRRKGTQASLILR